MNAIGLTPKQRASGGRYAGTAVKRVESAWERYTPQVSRQMQKQCKGLGFDPWAVIRYCERLEDRMAERHSMIREDLTGYDLAAMFIEQRGLCALTGATLTLAPGSNQATPVRKTIGQFTSWRPYNVVIVAHHIAERLTGMGSDDFVKLCERVARHARSYDPEAELLAAIEAA